MKYASKDGEGNFLILDTKEDGIFWWIYNWVHDKFANKFARCGSCGTILEAKDTTKKTKTRIYVKCNNTHCQRLNWVLRNEN